MGLKTGEYVVYGSSEICRVEGEVERCFDGKDFKTYYKLIPVYSKGSSVYIPVDDYEGKTRELLSKDEILSLIDDIPNSQCDWCEDKKERKNQFSSVLHGSDYHELMSMVRVLHLQQIKQTAKGKKLYASDEKAMQEAEKLIQHEFAFVLGIDEKSVNSFIKKRLEEKSSKDAL